MIAPENPQLAPCPCGQVPSELMTVRWNNVDASTFGICCGGWEVGFIYAGDRPTENEAREAWNAAPRGHGS